MSNYIAVEFTAVFSPKPSRRRWQKCLETAELCYSGEVHAMIHAWNRDRVNFLSSLIVKIASSDDHVLLFLTAIEMTKL